MYLSLVRRVLKGALNAVIWPLVELGSNRLLLAGITIITIVWLTQSTYSSHPWDNMRAGAPKLVLAFTVWYGLIEGATKVVQAESARRDRKMQAKLQKHTELIAQQNAMILTLTQAVRAALDRSEERDDLLRELVLQLLDRIESSGIPQAVTDLALAVKQRLVDEADTPFHALVARLADAILAEVA